MNSTKPVMIGLTSMTSEMQPSSTVLDLLNWLETDLLDSLGLPSALYQKMSENVSKTPIPVERKEASCFSGYVRVEKLKPIKVLREITEEKDPLPDQLSLHPLQTVFRKFGECYLPARIEYRGSAALDDLH